MTDEERKAQKREYMRKWRQEHQEQCREYKRRARMKKPQCKARELKGVACPYQSEVQCQEADGRHCWNCGWNPER